jgi:hypothetical protein
MNPMMLMNMFKGGMSPDMVINALGGGPEVREAFRLAQEECSKPNAMDNLRNMTQSSPFNFEQMRRNFGI